jgi:UDP-N-acetylglucosamine 1-carboxyvinyltransferase
MRWIEVRGDCTLKGSVSVPGSKNSTIALLTACCLASEPVTLKNIPDISDVEVILSIANDIGIEIIFPEEKNTIIIDPTKLHSSTIDVGKSSTYRAAYYFMGALLAKFKKVSVGYPGGDNFGSRPIDQHVKGFEALGAKFAFYEDYYEVEADKLCGNNIYFDVITSGATINVIMAAVLAEGRTVLLNAARDPEVVDLAILLNKMGANIKGMGTSTIIIDGVKELSGCTHCIIPDRLIAGSYLIAAGAARGTITVKDIIPEHLVSCTAKLEEAGIDIETGDNYITAHAGGDLKGIKIRAAMYPGFPTDLQQPLTAMLLSASSNSTIIDTVYPNRFRHCVQLNRMGADIIIRNGRVIIPSKRKLTGSWVHATDVRAGICLILAGMMAEGVTSITGLEHIERGYPDIVASFTELGANIKLCKESVGEIFQKAP